MLDSSKDWLGLPVFRNKRLQNAHSNKSGKPDCSSFQFYASFSPHFSRVQLRTEPSTSAVLLKVLHWLWLDAIHWHQKRQMIKTFKPLHFFEHLWTEEGSQMCVSEVCQRGCQGRIRVGRRGDRAKNRGLHLGIRFDGVCGAPSFPLGLKNIRNKKNNKI